MGVMITRKFLAGFAGVLLLCSGLGATACDLSCFAAGHDRVPMAAQPEIHSHAHHHHPPGTACNEGSGLDSHFASALCQRCCDVSTAVFHARTRLQTSQLRVTTQHSQWVPASLPLIFSPRFDSAHLKAPPDAYERLVDSPLNLRI